MRPAFFEALEKRGRRRRRPLGSSLKLGDKRLTLAADSKVDASRRTGWRSGPRIRVDVDGAVCANALAHHVLHWRAHGRYLSWIFQIRRVGELRDNWRNSQDGRKDNPIKGLHGLAPLSWAR